MSNPLSATLYRELDKIPLIDPHTHIDPHRPAAQNLAELLGYHYYTELAHSAGLPTSHFANNTSPKQMVADLVTMSEHLDNTIQWSWMLELSRELFGFADDHLGPKNWESLFDLAQHQCSQSDWTDQVLARTGVESLFLTNDFDDPLAGFDTQRFVPCLRTDDLVFHFRKASVQNRLQAFTERSVTSLATLDHAIQSLFEHFTRHNARACAISLPPSFAPHQVPEATAEQALEQLLQHQEHADGMHQVHLSYWIFWRLAEWCAEFRLPFDLMIGVNRQVYPAGVFQGQDLYDSRLSLIQYAPLFNHFPNVKFPISVLASVTNQELTDYAWIFPNVITHGHWWYSNTPSFIRRDLAARMEAIPRNKIVGYYSDAYKIEFMLPKFRMFKRILADVLAEEFVVQHRWSEERAIQLGYQILRGNVEATFGKPS